VEQLPELHPAQPPPPMGAETPPSPLLKQANLESTRRDSVLQAGQAAGSLD